MTPEHNSSAPHQVEAYLDQILAPLARRLSPFHRDELRRELRAHLWARVDAYRELGTPDDKAVTEALRQFGGADDFLRQWQQEWMIAARSAMRHEIWVATLAGLRSSLLTLLLACTPIIVWVSQATPYGHSHPWLKSWLERDSAQIGPILAWLDLVILPAILGVVIGYWTPRRAGLGVFLALAGEITLGVALDRAGLLCWPQLPVINDVFGQTALLEFFWMPTACLTATLTGWGRRRLKARRFA